LGYLREKSWVEFVTSREITSDWARSLATFLAFRLLLLKRLCISIRLKIEVGNFLVSTLEVVLNNVERFCIEVISSCFYNL